MARKSTASATSIVSYRASTAPGALFCAEANATSDTFGVGVGVLEIGVAVLKATVSPEVNVAVGAGAFVMARGNITIQARHNTTANGTRSTTPAGEAKRAFAKANAAGGGLVSGSSAVPVAIAAADVSTTIHDNAVLKAGDVVDGNIADNTGNVSIISYNSNDAKSIAQEISPRPGRSGGGRGQGRRGPVRPNR